MDAVRRHDLENTAPATCQLIFATHVTADFIITLLAKVLGFSEKL
jgi:hypothetical protein